MAFSDFKTVSEVQKEFRITYSEDDFVRGEPSTPSEHFLKEDDTSLKRCQFECRRGSANTRTLPTPKENTMKDTTPNNSDADDCDGKLLIVTALLLMLMLSGCGEIKTVFFSDLDETNPYVWEQPYTQEGTDYRKTGIQEDIGKSNIVEGQHLIHDLNCGERHIRDFVDSGERILKASYADLYRMDYKGAHGLLEDGVAELGDCCGQETFQRLLRDAETE